MFLAHFQRFVLHILESDAMYPDKDMAERQLHKFLPFGYCVVDDAAYANKKLT